MKIVITGTNRGIGLEFCRQFATRGDDVVAVCRRPSEALLALGVKILTDIDVTHDDAPKRIADGMKGQAIDVLINNAGIMEPVTLSDLDLESLRRQFEVNAVAPLRITHALLPLMGAGAKVGVVTTRMGSIDDNTSGGSYGYRMSKVAANMAGRSLAVDLAKSGVNVALLHPGWVRTDMTGGNGLINADESVEGLIKVMDGLSAENTGLFWHTNGEVLTW